MEPSFMMEDYDDVEEVEELEEETSANRRQFTILVVVFGGILAIAVIALLFIILSRNGEKSDIELTNEAVQLTNTAVVKAQVAMATEDAAAVTATEEARVMALTQQAEEALATEAAVETAAAGTAVAVQAATATAGARPTRTPTPVVPTATATLAESEQATADAATAEAVAQLPSTPMRTATKATAGTTPDTGVGGLGTVLIAAVLIVVLFAARRLRMAT